MRAFRPALASLLVVAGCGDGAGDGPAASTCEALLVAPVLPSPRLTVDGAHLRDALGRDVLLRGVNAGGRAKLPPFFAFPFAESGLASQRGAPPFDDAVAAYLDRVAAWGHDVIRLPFTWEAVEPTRGAYDDAFLERYAAVAAAAGARGLRVIVDMHQDVFARPYCGDGFPLWATSHPDAAPPDDCTQWFRGYTDDERVRADLGRFWRDDDGLMTAFVAMWRRVAARLWEVDGVVAFEILNEPAAGDLDESTWARDVLAPFYARLADEIRAVAPGAPVLVDATGFEAVIAETALPRPDTDGVVFAPHYYDPLALLSGVAPEDGDAMTPLGRWRAVGDDWQAPVLVGELGIRPAAEGAAAWVRANFDALDAHRLHATLWEYSATADDWNDEAMSVVDGEGRELATAAELVRAYPLAVAGDLLAWSFDRGTLAGTLRVDAAPGGVTEVRTPTRLYPRGVVATVTAGDACAAPTADGERLLVASPTGGPVTLELAPAP
ncbi:MAG: cellulase family glycosylhydrolase [Deltaproteobacteria bacterium]|nr:cellulase family glycosylhydrolase [Deltaproteobacteria bacterium]